MTRLRLLLVALSFGLAGCSILYDADKLHDAADGGDDGGVRDTGALDSGVRDTGRVDSGAVDSGLAICRGTGGDSCTEPSATSASWDEHGTLTVRFDRRASADTTYEVVLGPAVTTFTLPSGAQIKTLRYMVPLFRSTDTLVIRPVSGCADPFCVTVETTHDRAGASPGLLTATTPAMDIANDGTVVFISRDGLAPGVDRLFRWVDGAMPQVIVDATPTVPNGLAGPRISDDGHLIVYWTGDSADVDSPTGTGEFRYLFDGDGSSWVHAPIGPPTAFVATDLRVGVGVGAASEYIFVMRASDFRARLGVFTESELLRAEPLSTTDTTIVGGGFSLGVFMAGSGPMAFVEGEPGASGRHANSVYLPGGTPISASACTVAGDRSVAAVGPDGGVSYVGSCDGGSYRLHESDSPSSGVSVMPHDLPMDADSLLAASDDRKTYLIRQSARPDAAGEEQPGKLWVARLVDGALQTHVLGPSDGVPALTHTTKLDLAALSPDGHWVVYPVDVRAPTGTPPEVHFGLVRAAVF